MDLGLKGKGVIVTGGASNIGRAIVLTFAREGARIAIAEIDDQGAERVAHQAQDLGAEVALPIHCDVTDRAQVEAMVQRAIEELGGVHALVNNVGWDRLCLFLDDTWEDMEKKVRINLWSVIYGCRAVLPHMIERGGGAIVNIGSDAGRMGEYREAVYSACKGGIISLTKALAREYGRYNVRVNCVCPGTTIPQSAEEVGSQSMWRAGSGLDAWTSPEMRERIARAYPMRRLGTAQEVANAVVFLASDAASFITGQTLSVSGGYTMM
ncbi:MAG: SDR family oxidoreductase [Dehalococcoidia bacterium]|jgi:2-hydroxycyclohexanecarboxyl-CoA dehydrogenase|nr:SDR family oxidoreductase [Dehalococcoidia bacterium]